MYRLGIIGTGRIAERMVKTGLTGLNVSCECVYNPHLESAKRFAEANHIGMFTDNLDTLAACTDVIYVASPHETHRDYTEYMLGSGKHVLCEKPMALKEEDGDRLYKLAKEKNLVLKEAVKTAFCPGFNELAAIVESGKIGRVIDVEAAFTRLTPINTREYLNPVYNGSMLEFGSYGLLPVMRFLGTDYKNVTFNSVRSRDGVDVYTKAYIEYDGGMATVKSGLGVKTEGQLVISGTLGYIIVPSPWWMTRKFQVRFEDSSIVENYEYPYEGSGLQYEMAVFLASIMDDSFNGICVTEKESIAMASVMEKFLDWNTPQWEQGQKSFAERLKKTDMPKVWAHRGCSMRYPENTLLSFKAAAEVPGITGIELDVQFTRDNEIVVFHDENVGRVTDGDKAVKEYSLEEIKKLKIYAGKDSNGENTYTTVPTLREVLELLKPYCEKNGLLINIELKTGVERYKGIEEKTYNLVKSFGMEKYIVYSSFLPESVAIMKEIDADCKTGILAVYLDECESMAGRVKADALHPAAVTLGYDIHKEFEEMPVRVWNWDEPFFEDGRTLNGDNLYRYRGFGATDIITNVPENYLM